MLSIPFLIIIYSVIPLSPLIVSLLAMMYDVNESVVMLAPPIASPPGGFVTVTSDDYKNFFFLGFSPGEEQVALAGSAAHVFVGVSTKP